MFFFVTHSFYSGDTPYIKVQIQVNQCATHVLCAKWMFCVRLTHAQIFQKLSPFIYRLFHEDCSSIIQTDTVAYSQPSTCLMFNHLGDVCACLGGGGGGGGGLSSLEVSSQKMS